MYHQCETHDRSQERIYGMKPKIIEIYGISVYGVIWTIISVLVTGKACTAYYMPYWIHGAMSNGIPTSLGVFRRCNYLKYVDTSDSIYGNTREIHTIGECGRYNTFKDIPSLWWQVVTIVMGIGCALLALVAIFTLLACCISDVISRTTARVAGTIQFFAGLCISIGSVLYPLGWDSFEIKQICGPDAHVYSLGTCTISWAYYCAIASAAGSFICFLFSLKAAKVKQYSNTN